MINFLDKVKCCRLLRDLPSLFLTSSIHLLIYSGKLTYLLSRRFRSPSDKAYQLLPGSPKISYLLCLSATDSFYAQNWSFAFGNVLVYGDTCWIFALRNIWLRLENWSTTFNRFMDDNKPASSTAALLMSSASCCYWSLPWLKFQILSLESNEWEF